MSNSILAKADVLLDVQALAKKLRITRRSVYAWIERGWLPEPVAMGHRLFFEPSEVDRALGRLHEKQAAARAERRKKKAPKPLPTASGPS